jgi:hypothetical protein
MKKTDGQKSRATVPLSIWTMRTWCDVVWRLEIYIITITISITIIKVLKYFRILFQLISTYREEVIVKVAVSRDIGVFWQ